MNPAQTPRYDNSSYASVKSFKYNENSLSIIWEDNHTSTFPNIWLRDNCSCDSCGDHSGGSRFFELGMMSGDLTIKDIGVNDGVIKLNWNSDGHVTLYDASWLRSHCLSKEERGIRLHKPILWDKELKGHVPEADYDLARTDETERLKIFDAVRDYGLCLIRNMPAEPEETEKLAELVSIIRETHYGRMFEIVSTPDSVLVANKPVPLRPHTDQLFRETLVGIMIFHTIQASEDGGGASVMCDGFMLANELKRIDPKAYELLSTIPVPHRRYLDDVGLRAETPVLQHNYYGQLKEVRINERTMGPLDIPHDLIEATYEALKKLYAIAYDSRFHLQHLLNSGEAMVFDNARVLHARTGFNGNRHVRLCHVDSDEFYSRWRQLRSKLHGDINLI
jgi:gamma-butyrobetaine dioxygenase/trimethyllysine dioxygenase